MDFRFTFKEICVSVDKLEFCVCCEQSLSYLLYNDLWTNSILENSEFNHDRIDEQLSVKWTTV